MTVVKTVVVTYNEIAILYMGGFNGSACVLLYVLYVLFY